MSEVDKAGLKQNGGASTVGPALKRFDARLTDRDFKRFSKLVYDHYGIKLPSHKRSMLEARLRRRLRAHTFSSFEEYAELIFPKDEPTEEFIKLINVVTTNKTDFFREPAHFDYLIQSALPFLIETFGAGINKPLSIWSAGCSTGKEPYTLAMVLKEFQLEQPDFSFDILGTDICTEVLEKSVQGIYAEVKVAPIPERLKKKYLLRSKDPETAGCGLSRNYVPWRVFVDLILWMMTLVFESRLTSFFAGTSLFISIGQPRKGCFQSWSIIWSRDVTYSLVILRLCWA